MNGYHLSLTHFRFAKKIDEVIPPEHESTIMDIEPKRYMSARIEDGVTPTEHDDLIQAGYIAIELQCGFLSWDGADDRRKTLKHKLHEMVIK